MKDVEWNEEKFNKELRLVVRRRLVDVAVLFKRKLHELFRMPKSGIIYGTVKALDRHARQTAKVNRFNETFGDSADRIDARSAVSMRGLHQASAPGEAPAIDTGALAKSVTHEITETPEGFNLDIGPSAQSGRDEIAGYLEFGTSKIAPRPAWRPALEAVAQQTESEIRIAAEG